MTLSRTADRVHLAELNPALSADEITGFLVPPPQFETATLDSYRPDPDYPSQADAVTEARTFIASFGAKAKSGLFGRRKASPSAKAGLYLDGGFGVGKTHLLASIWREAEGPKYFGTFMQYTALVGALGYQGALDALRSAKLICIDEFELDDPGDTMVMTRLIKELVSTGTRIAATSNTPPNALGEGRFAAADFLREIQAMSDSFETLRIDGLDYRRRSSAENAVVLTGDDLEAALARYETEGSTVSSDTFDSLIAHLATLHPSKYIKLLAGVDAIGISDVHVLYNQAEALRLVAFIDRVYDAQIPLLASGTPLDGVFSDEMVDGGYRKKYLRAVSRMVALTSAGRAAGAE